MDTRKKIDHVFVSGLQLYPDFENFYKSLLFPLIIIFVGGVLPAFRAAQRNISEPLRVTRQSISPLFKFVTYRFFALFLRLWMSNLGVLGRSSYFQNTCTHSKIRGPVSILPVRDLGYALSVGGFSGTRGS